MIKNVAQIFSTSASLLPCKMAKHELQARLWGDPKRKSRRSAPYLESIAFFGGAHNDVIISDERLGTSNIFGASVMVDSRNTS